MGVLLITLALAKIDRSAMPDADFGRLSARKILAHFVMRTKSKPHERF
jgi:hypothetical protein